MIQKLKITNNSFRLLAILNDQIIYEEKKFDSDVDMEVNLRSFMIDLLVFNLNWYTLRCYDNFDNMNFRQQEAVDILKASNQWFNEHRVNQKLIIDAFQKARTHIDDCPYSFADRTRKELLIEGFEVIKQYFDYVDERDKKKFG